MSTKTYLKQFDFELWSNTLILNSLKEITVENERAFLLFSHLINSHCMWINRLKGEPLTCTLFETRTLESCKNQMQENHKKWTSYLTAITDEELDRIIEFDAAWENNVRRKMRIEDALIHLINHSSYHRGQIVASIKGSVQMLPLSTYIIYASNVVDANN
jgi:uncharacterized damage-inducible protein DinB